MEITIIEIEKLRPAAYNPRVITKEEFEGLKVSLKTFGLVEPIIVNRDLVVIGGHQRIKVWKSLGNTSFAT